MRADQPRVAVQRQKPKAAPNPCKKMRLMPRRAYLETGINSLTTPQESTTVVIIVVIFRGIFS